MVRVGGGVLLDGYGELLLGAFALSGATATGPSPPSRSGPRGLDVELDGDRPADEHGAGLERPVPAEADVLPVHLGLRAEAGAGAAPGVGRHTLVLDLQADGSGRDHDAIATAQPMPRDPRAVDVTMEVLPDAVGVTVLAPFPFSLVMTR